MSVARVTEQSSVSGRRLFKAFGASVAITAAALVVNYVGLGWSLEHRVGALLAAGLCGLLSLAWWLISGRASHTACC